MRTEGSGAGPSLRPVRITASLREVTGATDETELPSVASPAQGSLGYGGDRHSYLNPQPEACGAATPGLGSPGLVLASCCHLVADDVPQAGPAHPGGPRASAPTSHPLSRAPPRQVGGLALSMLVTVVPLVTPPLACLHLAPTITDPRPLSCAFLDTVSHGPWCLCTALWSRS